MIQVVALSGWDFALARSITGAVHELFEGTEQVRQGDFTHKIPIRTRDQLGELAESFNSMTASIEDLLQQKAEKERLEQELRIAREIQMSLLPQGPLRMPGLALTGHCEPAREVGGDYYDFLPIDEHRFGMLIADVAGKGTSAALYMAELKGMMLSLSQLAPLAAALLIDANRIISRHLDHAQLHHDDLRRGRRAGADAHLRARRPLPAHLPAGPACAPSRQVQMLAPDGLVLGLKIDDGETFARLLEEVTVPLGPGDLFVLYTDGFTEAMNPAGDFFGEERLGALHPATGAPAVRRAARADPARGGRFVGGAAQQDDMTMLLLKVEEQQESRSRIAVDARITNHESRIAESRRRLRHVVGHRGERRDGAARQPRHRQLPRHRQPAGDLADGGQRARAGAHRGGRRGRPTTARRIIESHREDVGARVVRLRDEFDELQTRIGYRFRDRGLLEHALTHKSRAAEDASGGVADNESLEFLGDAVLGLVVADALFQQYPAYNEGQKSKIKASVVSTQSLARHAEQMRLGDHLMLGRGEEKTGGRFKQALLADAYEALIAAIYLDGGLEAAAAFLQRELKDAIDGGASGNFVGQDYKSALQERVQALGRPLPEYRVSGESGPDHRKVFSVDVVVAGEVLGCATGKAKKEAEQEAARHALARSRLNALRGVGQSDVNVDRHRLATGRLKPATTVAG